MELLSEGIAVFNNIFLRNEEVIDIAEQSNNWREGTAGPTVNPQTRITDIHDLDQSTEIHNELLQAFTDGISEYRQKYPHCNITAGEHLRVGRYNPGGHYKPHVDSSGPERTLSGILYLNSDFDGGELNFTNQNIKIKPEEGMLVLFPSNFLFVHESLPVVTGKKYICLGWFR